MVGHRGGANVRPWFSVLRSGSSGSVLVLRLWPIRQGHTEVLSTRHYRKRFFRVVQFNAVPLSRTLDSLVKFVEPSDKRNLVIYEKRCVEKFLLAVDALGICRLFLGKNAKVVSRFKTEQTRWRRVTSSMLIGKYFKLCYCKNIVSERRDNWKTTREISLFVHTCLEYPRWCGRSSLHCDSKMKVQKSELV